MCFDKGGTCYRRRPYARRHVRELWRFISKWARIGARGQEVDCPTTDYAQPTLEPNPDQEADCPISVYTEAIQSNPNDVAAYLARGTAHFNASAFDSAIADFTKAIELNTNDASAYTNRGSAHYEKAEFDRAIADLNKAIEINPKSALAYSNLGWTYEAMGDERKAIAHYRKALEIDPSLDAARDNPSFWAQRLSASLFTGRRSPGIERAHSQYFTSAGRAG
jgi:tetratricopeptide (TPR) repeat protein